MGLGIRCIFGGNGTLIGSSAGVVAAGLSERFGYRITFIRWLKIGFPFMLFTLANLNYHTSIINYNNTPLMTTNKLRKGIGTIYRAFSSLDHTFSA